jgi:phosphoribosylglycinamide formyltransferase 2
VILAEREAERFSIQGLREALELASKDADVEVRLFGKPTTRKHRRMGVALASGSTVEEARERACQAADRVQITYGG